MKTSALALLALALSIAVFATSGQTEEEAPPEISGISWRTDLDGAVSEAKREGRPLLVVFR